jgi:hypothetical protein
MDHQQATTAVFLRPWLNWTAGFLAFPIAGLAGAAPLGRVDDPAAALIGGTLTGLILGAGQALVSQRRLDLRRWATATALGMGLGLLLGATAVDYQTTLADLALMGAMTGVIRASRRHSPFRSTSRCAGCGPLQYPCCGHWAGPLPHSAGSPSTNSSPSSAHTGH